MLGGPRNCRRRRRAQASRMFQGAVLSSLIALVLGLSGTAQQCDLLNLRQAADQGIITLRNKNGYYIGDVVELEVNNSRRPRCVDILVRPGDVLLNRSSSQQNLVVTRLTGDGVTATENGWVMHVARDQTATAEGIWVLCLDAHEGSPNAGRTFDIPQNLEEWGDDTSTPHRLLAAIKIILRYGIEDTMDAQHVVWYYTDARKPDPSEARVCDIIIEEGGDCSKPPTDCPHPKNPLPPSTGAARPITLIDPDIAPPIDLSSGDTLDKEVRLESAMDSVSFLVSAPPMLFLNVATRDCCVRGDIWEVSIYDGASLLVRAEGSGSIEVYSGAARVATRSAQLLVTIRYIRGNDRWPADLNVKFWLQ